MSRQISFDEMVRLALQEEERRRWAAYPDRETLRKTYGDLSELKARIDATLRAHRLQKEQALPLARFFALVQAGFDSGGYFAGAVLRHHSGVCRNPDEGETDDCGVDRAGCGYFL